MQVAEQSKSFFTIANDFEKILRNLYITRFMDRKMEKMVRQNKGTTFFLSTQGHELVGTVASSMLTPKVDWAFPYYRDRAFALGLGCSIEDLFTAFLARQGEKHSTGKLMLDHFSDHDLNIPPQSSVVGSQFLQAVGRAKGIQLKGDSSLVYVSSGEGATSQGDFHEALNYSCIHHLPILFVIQDNGYAISTPVLEQTAGSSIMHIAKGYPNLQAYSVDGTDFLSLSTTMKTAVQQIRAKNGPSLIVAKVPRIGAHTSSDDPSKYKTPSEIETDKQNDPIPKFEKWLLEEKHLSQVEIEKIQKSCFDLVEEEAIKADAKPFFPKEFATCHILKNSTQPEEQPFYQPIFDEPVVMMDAINHALIEAMKKDEGVVVFGEDVARGKGGVFGLTRGITDLFGKNRCFNTPLAESTIVGTAIGLAFDGFFKPIAEIQFSDFSWPAMNQIVNELASVHYRSNGHWTASLVIRMATGGYIQGALYHSQSLEAIFCHIPGLKVVIPSNAADAKGLLKSAIEDPNPVIFLEHKALYRQVRFSARKEPDADYRVPLGKAKIVKEGSNATIITWGMTTLFADEIAEKLSKEEISLEVIDLRTLSPIDWEMIFSSVKKTGKALIAHEAPLTCGLGAEISARISHEVFSYLDAPVARLGAKESFVPYAKNLEEVILPQKEDLEKSVRALLDF